MKKREKRTKTYLIEVRNLKPIRIDGRQVDHEIDPLEFLKENLFFFPNYMEIPFQPRHSNTGLLRLENAQPLFNGDTR